MRINHRFTLFETLALALVLALTGAVSRSQADTGTCGGVTTTLPFTDVMGNAFFCQIAEAYFSGLTNGTTATTYSPTNTVTREQMAAFITRTQDSALRRGSHRAALKQWWTPQSILDVRQITVGDSPLAVESDGEDLWIGNFFGQNSGTVSRVHASDGRVLGTWTGAISPVGLLVARGRIYLIGCSIGGPLYSLDPTQPPGAVSVVANNLGDCPEGIAFDGS